MVKEPETTITIVVVDDHSLMREGLRHILSQQTAIMIVGEASNGRDALRLVQELQPHVVLMDISMPDMNGIEATARILSENHGTHVVALSMHTDRHFVMEALKAGAKGFLPKNCSVQELFEAVTAAARDEYYFSPPQCAAFIEEYLAETCGTGVKGQTLSGREREVLQLLAEGRNTKEIAFSLDISTKTVEFHRQQIMKKLNIFNLPELTKFAVREGITSI